MQPLKYNESHFRMLIIEIDKNIWHLSTCKPLDAHKKNKDLIVPIKSVFVNDDYDDHDDGDDDASQDMSSKRSVTTGLAETGSWSLQGGETKKTFHNAKQWDDKEYRI